MTITLPLWFLYAASAAMFVSIALNIIDVILSRKLIKARNALHQQRLKHDILIAKVLERLIDYDKKHNARWMRYGNVKSVDIKSPIIAADGNILKFANGVTVTQRDTSTQVQMDS